MYITYLTNHFTWFNKKKLYFYVNIDYGFVKCKIVLNK